MKPGWNNEINKVCLDLCYLIHDSFTFLKKELEDFADFVLEGIFFLYFLFLVTYISCDMICRYFYLENVGLYLYIWKKRLLEARSLW